MRSFFSSPDGLQKLWGGPPVRGRPPGRPSRLDEIDPVAKSGSRGTRADQGVCPTIFAELSQLEKRVALRLEASTSATVGTDLLMSRNSAELVAQAEKAGKMAGGAMLIRLRREDDSEPEARLKASSPAPRPISGAGSRWAKAHPQPTSNIQHPTSASQHRLLNIQHPFLGAYTERLPSLC